MELKYLFKDYYHIENGIRKPIMEYLPESMEVEGNNYYIDGDKFFLKNKNTFVTLILNRIRKKKRIEIYNANNEKI